jgi:hypothetical protein
MKNVHNKINSTLGLQVPQNEGNLTRSAYITFPNDVLHYRVNSFNFTYITLI